MCLEPAPKLFEEGRPRGRKCRNYRCHTRQIRIDQCRNLVPYAEVILDFVMRFVQGPRIPTVVVAIYWTVFIGHPKVPDDLCPCGISRENFRGSMKRTFCLIEIDRACYVRGELGGFVTRFSNRVYLDGERDRNAHLP